MEYGVRRLQYFSVLAEELNFRRAARRLNITQPALSRAIAQLEAETGLNLLDRSNRQVTPTAAGLHFAEGCRRVLVELHRTVDTAARIAQGAAGRVTIGYTDTAIAGILPDLIRSFRSEAPGVQVSLIQIFTARQYEMLREGTLDVGIMTGPVTAPEFAVCDIQTDRLVALVPKDTPLAGEADIALSDLADAAFVQGDPEFWGVYDALLLRECEAAGFRPRVVQTAPESRAIVGLVACGLGISILPESHARGTGPRIAVRHLRGLAARMVTQAVWLTDLRNPAAHRFVRHAAQVVAAQRAR